MTAPIAIVSILPRGTPGRTPRRCAVVAWRRTRGGGALATSGGSASLGGIAFKGDAAGAGGETLQGNSAAGHPADAGRQLRPSSD